MSEELQTKTEILLAENAKLLDLIASGEKEIEKLRAELAVAVKQRDVFKAGFESQHRLHAEAVAEKKVQRLGPAPKPAEVA